LGGECQFICLSETSRQDIINFNPSGLFWKSNSRLVEQAELVLEVAKLGLPQIPSFEALFIAGDKAFLATLKNRDTSGSIPLTYVLSKNDLVKNIGFFTKNKAVLKPGDLSRGEGIKFGKNFTEKD
jgi:glutathione synthase/RimK-type ligase-like ATP-grasp enzyme